MVDKIHKRSPNMNLYRTVVQFRKNAKCLGATTVEDIYKAVEKLEGNQFADESSSITFTVDTRTHCHSAKKNVS